ncbi:hypothetical protein [Streptomyces sp. MI02-7b]|uniref:hypothetical protein n=1 Tax=Streptomyces sp. MI02-7b TaxID=462941 RepID=UPI0029B8F92A|nr:hypothetical protein [Streptomyces sp. MI02-7b]MDX3077615.1 hypothetical protein [Streptomyces sp. MI02-7b]
MQRLFVVGALTALAAVGVATTASTAHAAPVTAHAVAAAAQNARPTGDASGYRAGPWNKIDFGHADYTKCWNAALGYKQEAYEQNGTIINVKCVQEGGKWYVYWQYVGTDPGCQPSLCREES